jgi:hypothetical protein
MGSIPRLFIAGLIAGHITGCGLLYTNVTRPLTDNMDGNQICDDVCGSATHEFRYPFATLGPRIQWANHAIGDAAKRHGLERVNYADIHTTSIILGLWKRVTVQVYGKPAVVKIKPAEVTQ